MTERVRVQPLRVAVADAVVLEPGRVAPDATLRTGGQAHLDALLTTRELFDGPVLCWLGPHPGGGIRVMAGGYFDTVATCDAIRQEGSAGPLRDRALAAAGGDPLASGAGRAAAVGVTVLATRPGPDGERRLTLGRRSARVAGDAGLWHLAPSGMLEPDPSSGERHLAATVATELAEELGVTVNPADVEARARVLGLVHDLGRLPPDIVVRLDLTAGEAPAGALPRDEFDAFSRCRRTVAG